MLTCRILGNLDPASALGQRWEELVQASPACGVMQSLSWAAFKHRQGLRTLHLGVFIHGDLIGGALCYAPPEGLGAGLLVAPEGPLLPWEQHDLARAALRAILEAAEQAAAVYGALALRIEPRIAPPRPRVLRTFRRAPVDLVTTETLYVDLAPPPETILAQMQPKGRYNIRLAARRGVTVAAEYSPAAVQRFYAILQEASLRDDFFIESPAFFNDLLAELVPAGHAQLLFAKHADDTLGALLLITYGQRGTYLYGGIANQKRNLMAGYALQWAAMLRARAVGCTCYDFYGYEPYGAPDHLYASFSRFKRQFGGQAIRFIGAHDTFFLDRLSDAVIQVAKQSVGMA